NDPLGGAGWSNEKRSPKGKRANGGGGRLSSPLKAKSETSPPLRDAKSPRAKGAPPSSLVYDSLRPGPTPFCWIVPQPERSRASVRDPVLAGPMSRVNHIYGIKPIANAASPAAVDPTPIRAKSLTSVPYYRRRAQRLPARRLPESPQLTTCKCG